MATQKWRKPLFIFFIIISIARGLFIKQAETWLFPPVSNSSIKIIFQKNPSCYYYSVLHFQNEFFCWNILVCFERVISLHSPLSEGYLTITATSTAHHPFLSIKLISFSVCDNECFQKFPTLYVYNFIIKKIWCTVSNIIISFGFSF